MFRPKDVWKGGEMVLLQHNKIWGRTDNKAFILFDAPMLSTNIYDRIEINPKVVIISYPSPPRPPLTIS